MVSDHHINETGDAVARQGGRVMSDTVQERARYTAMWTDDLAAARLLRECADLIDKLTSAACADCQGTGRRFPYVQPGCAAYGAPCAVCNGTGSAAP